MSMGKLLKRVAEFGVPVIAVILAAEAAPPAPKNCDNGIDDDGDGYVDAVDTGCLQGSESLANGCNPTPDPTNLIYNGHLECPGTLADAPDRWRKLGSTSPVDALWLQRASAPPGGVHDGSRVLKVLSDQPNTFTAYWELNEDLILEPDTWYEFSVDIASDGARLTICQPGETGCIEGSAKRSSYFTTTSIEVILDLGGGSRQLIELFGVAATGADVMDDFDATAGAYRTHKLGGYEPWRRLVTSFRTKDWDPVTETVYARLKTSHWPVGIVYFDNFTLRKTSPNVNSTAPPLFASGTLNFVKYNQADFFPIVFWGLLNNGTARITPLGSDYVTWRTYVGNGFNASGWFTTSASSTTRSSLEGWPTDLKFGFNFCNTYGGSPGVWLDDPSHLNIWTCPATDRSFIDFLTNKNMTGLQNPAARNNLLFVLTHDEVNCHPAEWGSPMRQLEVLGNARNLLHESGNFPQVPVIQNYCGNNYTGAPADLVTYLKVTDVFTHTTNLPRAYPGNATSPSMMLDTLGSRTRRILRYAEQAREGGPAKPQLAVGAGVREWADWLDGSALADEYLPYNLQRYQVFAQLINGATGVWFYMGGYTDVADSRDRVFLEQVRALSQEIAGLQGVLLVPTFDNTPVTVSDPRIEYMLKSHGGKRYLFAASSSPLDLLGVKFTLKGLTVKQVVAVGEVLNGDFRNPVTRVICTRRCNSFTDDFVGERDRLGDLQGFPASPGYAVHVYELTVQ